jgi:hypothetical protein
MSISKDGEPIVTLEDWEKRAGPKTSVQWKENRSALEAARCWLAVASPNLPDGLQSLLSGSPAFGQVLEWTAEPEVRLPFDASRGEPRNTDLLVQARDSHGKYLIAVEAKADESFGGTVSRTRAAAEKRAPDNPRSNRIARLNGLLAGILGHKDGETTANGTLRYQLLTAAAGAVNAARTRGCDRVLLLVHEFTSDATTDAKHAANDRDLAAFISVMSRDSVRNVESGRMHGPFLVPGVPMFEPPVPSLYVGKVVSNIRGRTGGQRLP